MVFISTRTIQKFGENVIIKDHKLFFFSKFRKHKNLFKNVQQIEKPVKWNKYFEGIDSESEHFDYVNISKDLTRKYF